MERFIEVYKEGSKEWNQAKVVMDYIGAKVDNLFLTGNPFPLPGYMVWDGQLVTMELHYVTEAMLQFEEYKDGFKRMSEHIYKLEKENKYVAIFNYMSSMLRFPIYNMYLDKMPESAAYEAFKFIYKQAENHFDSLYWDDIKELCKSQNIKDVEWLKEKYGDSVVVYRGETPESDQNGLSWTTSYKIAEFFAGRYDSQGCVLKGKVKTEDVLAFMDLEQVLQGKESEEELLIERENIILID